MRRTTGLALGALGLALLAGCGASGNDNTSTSEGAAAPVQQGADSAGKAVPDKPQAPAQGQQPQEQPSVTRAIIKTGSLTIKADDVAATRQKAITAIAGLDGQVSSEDTGSDTDGKITQVNLVLKVPTKSYDAAVERLSALGDRLQIHQESTDVTEQVVDVASRIESQRASLDRMRALMAKANTIGEIVSVESELTRREADLESLLAKQKNLSLQTDLATLNLTVTGKSAPVAEPKDPDHGFLAGLKGGWNAFTTTFSALATALGAVLPFLVLLALIGVPLWRFRHRLRRQSSAEAKAR
ncbi:DUF4349 domain-containing protein [Kribbella sp. NPDC051952]|uniref:DUF4349 domain-containing protein n=1 Tax=Kribbella sp. NPDC051952 TaxID=3154851 RepID=UPI0034288918